MLCGLQLAGGAGAVSIFHYHKIFEALGSLSRLEEVLLASYRFYGARGTAHKSTCAVKTDVFLAQRVKTKQLRGCAAV